jgi:hypothetical protein
MGSNTHPAWNYASNFLRCCLVVKFLRWSFLHPQNPFACVTTSIDSGIIPKRNWQESVIRTWKHKHKYTRPDNKYSHCTTRPKLRKKESINEMLLFRSNIFCKLFYRPPVSRFTIDFKHFTKRKGSDNELFTKPVCSFCIFLFPNFSYFHECTVINIISFREGRRRFSWLSYDLY